jgi:uncharacterized protein (TIGR02996 family)
MNEEEGFLQKLLDGPAEDATRLVYADWLEERGDVQSVARAEYLRLTVLSEKDKTKRPVAKRLQELAAALDTDWLAVVSRLKVENCANRRAQNELLERYRRRFNLVCDKRWDELTVTEERNVRFCVNCEKEVYYCDTITEARTRAQNEECVCVDLGIIRRKGDLSPPREVMGMLSQEFFKEEEARLAVDAVSLAREKQRLEKSHASLQSE